MQNRSGTSGGDSSTHNFTGEYEVTITTAKYVALLMGGEPETREIVIEALEEGFELLFTQELDLGLEAALQCAPDIIILDAGPREVEMVNLLTSDPMTEPIPILVLSELEEKKGDQELSREATGLLVKPFEPEMLRHMVISIVTGPHGAIPAVAGHLEDATIPEVLQFISRELEFGVLNALGPGAHNRKIPAGKELDLMRMLGSFISRVRDLIVTEPESKAEIAASGHERADVISLPVPPGDWHPDDGATSAIEIEETDVVAESPKWVENLKDIRTVVADDDEAIRSLFKNALTEHGALVDIARNGQEALAHIRETPPDLVITDIVMPEMGGWELVRFLRKEVLLWDIPVIVLSWREDFLLRMSELGAGASQYVLKDAEKSKILESISAALMGRYHTLRMLTGQDEGVGRVESIGVVPLLRLVAAGPTAMTLTIRETWNLFHVEFQDGQIAQVTNNTTGGFFLEGIEALSSLLGVKGGRFSLRPRKFSTERALEEDFDSLLKEAARPLQEMIDQVAGGGILDLVGVEFLDDILDEYLEVAPDRVRSVVTQLRGGATPRRLLFGNNVSPQELEMIVIDMIRRGVIWAIETRDSWGTEPPG